jgi:hypothetical protein
MKMGKKNLKDTLKMGKKVVSGPFGTTTDKKSLKGITKME